MLVLGRWRTDSPAHQHDACAAALAQWDAQGCPDGLESYLALAADDGHTVLQLSYWRDAAAVGGFTGAAKSAWAAGVDRRVPGIRRLGVRGYHRHGGRRFAEGAPGCLVLVDITTPDADAGRAWMDAMLAVGDTERPAPGMLSATFHLDAAGTAILNVAEWTDAAAHDALVTGPRSDASRGLIDTAATTHPTGFLRTTGNISRYHRTA